MKHLATLSLLVVVAVPCLAANTVATPPTPPPVAVKFLDLFDRLRAAQDPAGDHAHIAFQLTETDINDYLRHPLKATPRPGLDSITVKFLAKDYISSLTKIDFDAIERWHPGTIPAVFRSILKGKKAILIDSHINAADSKLTFTIEKARYEDLPLPSFFVEKVIQLMAARQPEKYDTSKPLPLPFGLKKLWTTEHLINGNN